MGHYTKLYGNTTCDYNDKYLCAFFISFAVATAPIDLVYRSRSGWNSVWLELSTSVVS